MNSAANAQNDVCRYLNRTTVNPIFSSAFEGIPENLAVNLVIWAFLILLFTILRKRAWDYGRLALVHKDNESRWTRIFYGNLDDGPTSAVSTDGRNRSVHSSSSLDRGFLSWISFTIQVTDESILAKSGQDAVQYLSFQRNVILLVGIITLISLGIILPINFAGDHTDGSQSFANTTVRNLTDKSSWLWVHVTFAILYLPLSIFVMRRFSMKLHFEIIDSVSRTLMITDIPRRYCEITSLEQHFKECYAEYVVQSINLAYDINKVSKLEQERIASYQARLYCDERLKSAGKKLHVYPHMCAYICSFCGISNPHVIDAIDYYTEKEEVLKNKIEQAKAAALTQPLGIAFVTMDSIEAAKRIYEDHKFRWRNCTRNPPLSSMSHLLQPHLWSVTFAPPPNDIFWENLSESSTSRMWKSTMVNTFLFIVLFFLTTPPIVLNIIDKLNLRDFVKSDPIISEFMPTLLLWTFSALLPVLVVKSDQWINHWTRSEQNHVIMRKTFIFLLFMVLILPSLGLVSAQAFVEFAFIDTSIDETSHWKCLFLPDKGAFFVNYVITSAFIGSALELIRFPELFLYAIRLALSRSQAESLSARKLILWEFPFGVHYAWMLVIFATMVVYSLSCPLITPFGLLYMIMKHFVDRYNIYFAYGPSKISQQIHATAINSVIVSIVLLQISFITLAVLRHGFKDITIFAIIGFMITILFSFAQCFVRRCEAWSPIYYQPAKSRATQSPCRRNIGSHLQYMPDVLRSGMPPQIRQQQVTVAATNCCGKATTDTTTATNILYASVDSFNVTMEPDNSSVVINHKVTEEL